MQNAYNFLHLLYLRKEFSKIPRKLHEDPDYQTYLRKQALKSRRFVGYAAPRVEHLSKKFFSLNMDLQGAISVLCVGSRNTHELALFRNAGYQDVVGIDLFSDDPSILPMDMHCMTFEGSRFDVLFACHVLEHSFEPKRAVKEFIRVLKPGGYCVIEVPVQFATTDIDRHDFGSASGLIQLFRPYIGELLLAEEAIGLDGRSRVVRVVLKTINKFRDSAL